MGSSALMVWVKDTATAPRLMLVRELPSVCTTASGEMALACGGGGWRAGQGRVMVGGAGRAAGRARCHRCGDATEGAALHAARCTAGSPERPATTAPAHVVHKAALWPLVQAQQPHGAGQARPNQELERGDSQGVRERLEHLLVEAAGQRGGRGRQVGPCVERRSGTRWAAAGRDRITRRMRPHMLNWMLKRYHSPNSSPRPDVRPMPPSGASASAAAATAAQGQRRSGGSGGWE